MLLVIDVGNTNVVLGVFYKDELLFHARLSTSTGRTVDEWAVLFKGVFDMNSYTWTGISRGVMCSVVPPVSNAIVRMVKKYININVLEVGPGVRTKMPVLYENPKEVGPDRIVNAVAAIHLYGSPAIVVDFGTAVTFDAIDRQGRYLGGAILPGLKVGAQALFANTSKLPMVDVAKPTSIIGRNTIDAIRSGLYHGYVSLVEGMVRRFKGVLGEDTKVIATGGHASLICEECPWIEAVDPLLTLKGLKIISQLNFDE